MLEYQVLTPFIVMLIYIITEILKHTALKNKPKYNAFLPICCALFGAVIGFILYKFMPASIVADNPISAISNGAFSGLATTGCNQIYKQMKKFNYEITDEDIDTKPTDTATSIAVDPTASAIDDGNDA